MVRAALARFAAPSGAPSAAVRNFLLLVEADGGYLLEADERLVEWADDFDEADRLGLFASDGGQSVGYRLTVKGEEFLRGFKATSQAALVLGVFGANRAVSAGFSVARDGDPER